MQICTLMDVPWRHGGMMMADKSWLAFTPDTTPEHARAVFAARYGVQPSEIIRTGGALLAGPVGPATPPCPTPPCPAPTPPCPGQLALFEAPAY